VTAANLATSVSGDTGCGFPRHHPPPPQPCTNYHPLRLHRLQQPSYPMADPRTLPRFLMRLTLCTALSLLVAESLCQPWMPASAFRQKQSESHSNIRTGREIESQTTSGGFPFQAVSYTRTTEYFTFRTSLDFMRMPVTETLSGASTINTNLLIAWHCYPIGVAANALLYLAAWCGVLHAIRRFRRPAQDQCERCGYDLRGLSDAACICPECGANAR